MGGREEAPAAAAGVLVLRLSVCNQRTNQEVECARFLIKWTKTRVTFPHSTGLLSRGTTYRNRKGYRRSQDKDRTAFGQLRHVHFTKVRGRMGQAGWGSQVSEAVPGAAVGLLHAAGVCLVVFESSVWVFFLKQT